MRTTKTLARSILVPVNFTRSSHTLVSFENVTLRPLRRSVAAFSQDHDPWGTKDPELCSDTNWSIQSDEHWCIMGRNGAGKSTLVGSLVGEALVVRGLIHKHKECQDGRIGIVSFEGHKRYIAEFERQRAMRDFGTLSDISHQGETVREMIKRSPKVDETVLGSVFETLGISYDLLERPMSVLSTGEIRKVLLASTMARQPRILILDEPFDGLDQQSRRDFAKILTRIASDTGKPCQLVMITHRIEECLDFFTNVLLVNKLRVEFYGPKDGVFGSDIFKKIFFEESFQFSLSSLHSINSFGNDGVCSNITRFRDVNVTYGKVTALGAFNWTMETGEKWAIVGENGAGKSTIIQMIAGDNLQSYREDLRLFDHPKAYFSSREIRQRIGLVSTELHLKYRQPTRALSVVLSGFFDTFGLYEECSQNQIEVADQWIDVLGIRSLMEINFLQLSQGQQKLVLLARALVKRPEVLIFDEPCQGLDIVNRHKLLALIDGICACETTNLIYVTHYEDELPQCVGHVLKLKVGQIVFCGTKDEFQDTHLSLSDSFADSIITTPSLMNT